MACRELSIDIGQYVKYVGVRPLLGALPGLGFLGWLKFGLKVHGLAQLTASGVAMVGLFAAIWVLFVYHQDPHLDLKKKLIQALHGQNA